MTHTNDTLLTVEEAADKLKVSTRTVQKHLRLGLLQGKKLGKRWYIPSESMIQLFAQ